MLRNTVNEPPRSKLVPSASAFLGALSDDSGCGCLRSLLSFQQCVPPGASESFTVVIPGLCEKRVGKHTTYIHTYRHRFVYIYIHIHASLKLQLHVYSYSCVCIVVTVRSYFHINVHIYDIQIYMYIYTYMYIYIQRHGNLGPHFVPPLKLEFEARIWRLNSARSS